jgi:hypothetical protein
VRTLATLVRTLAILVRTLGDPTVWGPRTTPEDPG